MISPIQEIIMYHDDKGPVPEAFNTLTKTLEKEHIDYVVIGALALAAHGYRRATEDIDICLRPEDLIRFKEKLVGNAYQTWRLRDLADVVELIRRNNLDEAYAEKLNPIVRTPFLECCDHRDEEDRMDREYGPH